MDAELFSMLFSANKSLKMGNRPDTFCSGDLGIKTAFII
jgi:hypothetical protein